MMFLSKKIREYVLVLLSLLGLMMLFMYPYPLHLWNFWPVHHDPALHNTTIFYSAKAILSGHLLPDFNSRFFYPYGDTLCLDDCFILQAMLFAPLYLLTQNPVFSFNISFLFFWALSGTTMYYFLNQLFKNKTAAFFGAFAFTLCPFRTSYYVELNMQMMWGIPLALAFMVRFFKTRRYIYLILFSLTMIGQAYTAWYYTIILLILMCVFIPLAILCKLYRPSWKDIFAGTLCSIMIGLAVLPYARPYMINNTELGHQREKETMDEHSADLSSYLAIREGAHSLTKSLIHSKNSIECFTESILSPGYFIYGSGLCFLLLMFIRRYKKQKFPSWAKILRILCGIGIFLSLSSIIFFIANHNQAINGHFSGFHFTMKDITRPANLIVLLWFIGLVISTRFNLLDRVPAGFTLKRMIPILFFTGFIFFILSLGPYIKFLGEHIGNGLVYYLYDTFFPIKATRVFSRYGIVVLFVVITFASILMAYLKPILKNKKVLYILITSGMFLTAGLEFIYEPYCFEKMDFKTPPQVYQWVKEYTPNDSVILEEPSINPYVDSKYMFWTHFHEKYILNGWSGFLSLIFINVVLDLYAELFPDENNRPIQNRNYKADTYKTIYPLKYLIVHLNSPYFTSQQKDSWLDIFKKSPSFLKPIHQFDQDLLFEFMEQPLSLPLHKTFSSMYIRDKNHINAVIDVPENEGIEKMDLILSLCEMEIHTLPLKIGKCENYKLCIDSLPYKAKPENLYFFYSYSLTPGFNQKPEYKIGNSDTYLPVDTELISEGLTSGDYCAIQINGMNYALQKRGLNVCALSPEGKILGKECFDPLITRDENERAVKFLSSFPAGTLLLLAVKDDYSLMDEKVGKALSDYGFTLNTRNLFRYSFLGIGVKGARPGSVIEKIGYEPLALTAGRKVSPPRLIHFECSKT